MSWRDDQIAGAMRAIDPARTSTDDSPHPRDWAQMRSIMAREASTKPRRHGAWRARAVSTVRLAWAIPALAVVAAIALTIVPLTMAPAYARTPPMLAVAPLSTSTQGVLSESEQILRSQPASVPAQNGQVVRWHLREDGRDDPVILPERQEWISNGDGTGYLRATAGAPYSVTKDGRIVAPAEDSPAKGTPIQHHGSGLAGADGGYFADTPPRTPDALRDYLRSHIRLPQNADAFTYWGAISALLNEWTLAPAQQAAAIELLQDAGGVTVIGTVTDRLGRDGIALTLKSETRPQFSVTVILDAQSRHIIAADTVYLGGLNRVDIPKDSVIEYSAWLQR
jgi:hypothetical protein